MDEEQPQKKITLSNFFEQIVEVNKVANAALTNSNSLRSQLNAVQLDLKRLVESLQVNFDSGVKNVQTQINEVTNVIVDDQRIKQSETDALEQQIFAQEDQLQKQVKGQKSKPTSEFGNIQKQNVADKSRSGLLGLGLLGGFSALSLGSNLLRKDKGNFFTNVFDKIKNFDGTPGSRQTKDVIKDDKSKKEEKVQKIEKKTENVVKKIEKKNENIVQKIEKKIAPVNITNNNTVNNNVVKEVIEEKKSDLVESPSNVPDDFDIDKHVASITVTSDSDNEEYVPFKYEHPYDPQNYQKSIDDMTARIVSKGEKTEAEARKFATEFVMKKVKERKEFLVEGKDYHPLFKPPGSDKPRPTMETVNKAYELGVSLDSLKDGGTTIIEGNDEVVNENIDKGQKRGDAIVDTEIVKSSNSPVASIAIAEGNSLNNLVI